MQLIWWFLDPLKYFMSLSLVRSRLWKLKKNKKKSSTYKQHIKKLQKIVQAGISRSLTRSLSLPLSLFESFVWIFHSCFFAAEFVFRVFCISAHSIKSKSNRHNMHNVRQKPNYFWRQMFLFFFFLSKNHKYTDEGKEKKKTIILQEVKKGIQNLKEN